MRAAAVFFAFMVGLALSFAFSTGAFGPAFVVLGLYWVPAWGLPFVTVFALALAKR